MEEMMLSFVKEFLDMQRSSWLLVATHLFQLAPLALF
jgi:hypothetical protein